jgi:hypothetical protein
MLLTRTSCLKRLVALGSCQRLLNWSAASRRGQDTTLLFVLPRLLAILVGRLPPLIVAPGVSTLEGTEERRCSRTWRKKIGNWVNRSKYATGVQTISFSVSPIVLYPSLAPFDDRKLKPKPPCKSLLLLLSQKHCSPLSLTLYLQSDDTHS